jgi:hypothetical protein
MKTNKTEFFEDIGYRPHKGQQTLHNSEARFRIVCAGRRWGKSLAAAQEALCSAIQPETVGWVIAPNYGLAEKIFREVLWTLKRKMPEWIEKESESRMFIKLKNGSIIEGKSAENIDSLVGEGLDWAILDEAARLPEAAWYQAIRPALADKEGWAMIISTPVGRNWFYKIFTRGQDSKFPLYASWTFPSKTNPFLAPVELQEAKGTLPERVYKQEIEAQFLDDSGAVFRKIRDCVRGDFEGPIPGRKYVIGADLAKSVDFTVICVIDTATRHIVHFDRFNKVDWSLQLQRIAEAAKAYNNASVLLDSTGLGDPVLEELRLKGVGAEGYILTNTSKKQLIEGLAMSIEKQDISFPDIPELINELEIYEYEMTRAGNIKYNAPEGNFHDDTVISLGLAVSALKSRAIEPIFDFGSGNIYEAEEQEDRPAMVPAYEPGALYHKDGTPVCVGD